MDLISSMEVLMILFIQSKIINVRYSVHYVDFNKRLDGRL